MTVLLPCENQMMKLLLAVLCAAFVAGDVTINDADGVKNMVAQVDIGSGGTRMSIFHYGTTDKKQTFCEYGGGGKTTDPGMLVVAREMFFICAKHSFLTRSAHIGTKLNVLADAASRCEWERFFAFAKSEFGVEREQMREVEPTLDTPLMLEKIRKAMLTERRCEAERIRAASNRAARE